MDIRESGNGAFETSQEASTQSFSKFVFFDRIRSGTDPRQGKVGRRLNSLETDAWMKKKTNYI